MTLHVRRSLLSRPSQEFNPSRFQALNLKSTRWAAIALLASSGLFGLSSAAQANNALYLQQTVQGVNLQNADSASILRGDGGQQPGAIVNVNCENYEGSDFINLSCVDADSESPGNELRWQPGSENLLSPRGNRPDGLNAPPSEDGSLKIFL